MRGAGMLPLALCISGGPGKHALSWILVPRWQYWLRHPCSSLHSTTWRPSARARAPLACALSGGSALHAPFTSHLSGEDAQAIRPVPLSPLHCFRTGGVLGVVRRLSCFYLPLGSSFLSLAAPLGDYCALQLATEFTD